MLKHIKKIHMIGIGGSGMSGIAEVLLNLGYKVSGSDLIKSEVTERLKKLGAIIFYTHKPENIRNVDLVVVSSAIKENNPEYVFAKQKNIPVILRAEMLAELARIKHTITIAGTHGKTTVTAMVGLILQMANYDPTVIIGGRLKNFGHSGAKLGKGEFLVAEADESDGSFLKLMPTIAIVTNIDDDHLDYYKNINNLKQAFIEHINKVPFYGYGILCKDDIILSSLFKKITRQYYTYGLNNNSDITARNIEFSGWNSKFDIIYKNRELGSINLHVPGIHNVLNSLSAILVGLQLGVSFNKIKKGLENFTGVGRRLEIKFKKKGITCIDDYGHHPTEILNTLNTLRKIFPDKRLIVIFQPHRFTRTKIIYKKFGPVFKKSDITMIAPIYPAGEKPIKGVSEFLIYNEVKKFNKNVELFLPDDEKNIKNLIKILKPGDVVLTLGAGNIYKLSDNIQKLL